jgi:hypothetical protein
MASFLDPNPLSNTVSLLGSDIRPAIRNLPPVGLWIVAPELIVDSIPLLGTFPRVSDEAHSEFALDGRERMALVKDTLGILRAKGLDIPVVVGGIIPEADALALKQMGVRRVYTPKDYKITQIMGDVVKVVEETIAGPPEEASSVRHWTTVYSIRRFWKRPNSVSFVARGLVSPYPLVLSIRAGTPAFTSAPLTTSARACDSARFDAGSPMLSVCPPISMIAPGGARVIASADASMTCRVSAGNSALPLGKLMIATPRLRKAVLFRLDAFMPMIAAYGGWAPLVGG